jgi:hypothetical protein
VTAAERLARRTAEVIHVTPAHPGEGNGTG